MANYTGAVRFPDGELCYFSLAGITDTARPRLFMASNEVVCEQADTACPAIIPDEERVEVMNYYANGDHDVSYMSRASRSLMLITGPRSWDTAQFESDEQNMHY